MNLPFRIALLQLAAETNNQTANLMKGDVFCRKAAAMGADLALFPEMWNIGYTPFRQHSAGMPVDQTELAQLEMELQRQAIDQHAPFFLHFQDLAKELELAIALTYLENYRNHLRNTVAIIDRHGSVIQTYAKVHTIDYSLEALCTPGEDFYVNELDTKNGRVKLGSMICFDRAFPESARILMLKGAEIILTPNAGNLDDLRISQYKIRSFENMVGVAMANYASPQNNGRSCAFDGMVCRSDESDRDPTLILAGEDEGIYLADFDLEDMRHYRSREIWGDAYRKPKHYSQLVSSAVIQPFIREKARR